MYQSDTGILGKIFCVYTGNFRSEIRKAAEKAEAINFIVKLANGEKLPEKNKDHALIGNYVGKRECHITPDWLLIYEIDNGNLFLYLTRTGTHSDLFNK